MKRFTIITTDPKKAVIHYHAMSLNEAKEKGNAIASTRNLQVLSILEGWTQPVGHIEEGKEIIKVG